MKINLQYILTIVVLVATTIFYVGQVTTSQGQSDEIAPTRVELTEEVVFDPLSILDPVLVPVCACESVGNAGSTPQQFLPNGEVVTGIINNLDKGACQINLHYWGEEALRLGFDIYTEEGNYRMANYILSTQGLEAWRWSNGCHHALD